MNDYTIFRVSLPIETKSLTSSSEKNEVKVMFGYVLDLIVSHKFASFVIFWLILLLFFILTARTKKYTASRGDKICWAISLAAIFAIILWPHELASLLSHLKSYLKSITVISVILGAIIAFFGFVLPDIFAEYFHSFFATILRWPRCMVAPFSAKAEKWFDKGIDRLEDSVENIKRIRTVRKKVKDVIDTKFEGTWRGSGLDEGTFIKLTNYLNKRVKEIKPDFSKEKGKSGEDVKTSRWILIKEAIMQWLDESVEEFMAKDECDVYIEHLKHGSEELGLYPLWREVLSRLESDKNLVKDPNKANAGVSPSLRFPMDLRAAPQTPVPTRQLRDMEEPFVGRREELERAKSFMKDLTSFAVVGPMGIGKSRLIRRAAEELASKGSYPFDMYAVVSISKGMDIGGAIDAAITQLNPTASAGGTSNMDPYQRLSVAIAGRKVLIVFENGELLSRDTAFHRLIGAVKASSSVFVLTTRDSHQAERNFSPQNRIKLEPLSEDETVALMRAHISEENIGKIEDEHLMRLNRDVVMGVPVFAKVAAGAINDWLKLKPKFDIDEFMREFHSHLSEKEVAQIGIDKGNRMLTLGALLNMSYSRLKPDEKRAFRVLSMLPIWTDELIAAVLEPKSADINDILIRLIDLALVENRETAVLMPEGEGEWKEHRFFVRYMHPGIRDIAQKWLEHEERKESLERILKFFIEFLSEHSDFHLLNAVDPYWPNIVELLEDKTVRSNFGELYAELVARLGRYFYLRGLWDYALRQLDSAARVAHDPKIKSDILWWMANIYRVRGEYEKAMQLYKKSLDIKEKIGDLQGKSATYHEMAYIHRVRGEYEKAMQLYKKSLDIKEKIGDLQGKSATYHAMAYIHVVRGEYEKAMQLYKKSLDIFEKIGDLKGKSATYHEMAYIHVVRGEYEKAMQLYKKSLDIKEKIGDLKGKASTLVMLGQLLVEHGDDEERARGLAHIMEGFVILKKLDAADAIQAFEILKDTVSLLPKSTYKKALSMVSEEERRIIEEALRG